MTQDYIKTEWVDKETVITAEKMNKIEEQMDVITDNVIAINESFDPEAISLLSEKVESMTKRLSDLEVKVHYLDESEKTSMIAELNVESGSAKITPEQGQIVKAARMVDVPEKSVRWQNMFSTFFAIDEAGKMTGNSNPAFSTAPKGTSFPHIGNLDPTLGIQELDRIEDLYSILCNFDFEKAAAVELESLKKTFPTSVKIKFVRHTINILDSEDQVVKTIKFDIYNPN